MGIGLLVLEGSKLPLRQWGAMQDRDAPVSNKALRGAVDPTGTTETQYIPSEEAVGLGRGKSQTPYSRLMSANFLWYSSSDRAPCLMAPFRRAKTF